VDNGGAALIVLLLGDPHLLEGGQGSKDGSSDPDGVLPLGRSDDLDLDDGGSKDGDLLLHTIGKTIFRRPLHSKGRLYISRCLSVTVCSHFFRTNDFFSKPFIFCLLVSQTIVIASSKLI